MSESVKTPAPARRGPPRALPIILALALPILYSLFAAPLFDSAANPDDNIGSALNVLVTSYDNGPVGTAFTNYFSRFGASGPYGQSSWVTNNGAVAVTMPKFEFVSASDYTPDQLREKVKNADAYAAIFLNTGASTALQGALASPAAAAAYMQPPNGSSVVWSTAISFVWDEARNNAVTAPRVAGPIKGLLGGFSTAMSNAQMQSWFSGGRNATTAGFTTPQQQALLSSILATPLSFTEENLFPFTLPAVNQALTVGQILLCVFGLIITNFIMGPLKAHPVTKTATSPLQLALRRFGLVLLFSCMVGIAYSTILTGLARTHNLTKLSQHFPSPVITHGATYFANGDFDGNVWASVWATQWLESIIFALYLMTAAVAAGGPEIAGALLGPMIIFNSISLSVDVSDPGFKFFWYAPMWHSSELVRNICFGTLSSRVGMHVGVHFAWAVLEVVLFFVVSIRKGLPVASIAASAPGVAEASKSAADTGTSIIVSVENAAVSTLTAVEAGMVTEAEVTAGTLLHKEGSTPVVMHGEPA